MALTVKQVTQIDEPGRYADGHGLYLQVLSPRNRSWILRYELRGRERWMGLGSASTFSLEEARARARAARQKLADGIDPIEARKAERMARALDAERTMTFEEAARRYYSAYADTWSNRKHAAQFMSTMQTYAFPVLGKLSVATIDTALVLKVLEPIWSSKTETASRVRSRIERVLSWAQVRGYRSGDNPAKWSGHLREALPSRSRIAPTQHHAALPFRDLSEFMERLKDREGVAARALEFTILTAARTGEVVGAEWPEIDLDAAVWTIPAHRMKAGREHRVPLSDRVIELLHGLPQEDRNAHVFIGTRARAGLSNMAMAQLLKRMSVDVTVHGFRSTFRDWAGETTAFPNHVIEMALAHTIKNKVEAAYRRDDLLPKRRQLMEAWAIYCHSPIKGGDVVALRRSTL